MHWPIALSRQRHLEMHIHLYMYIWREIYIYHTCMVLCFLHPYFCTKHTATWRKMVTWHLVCTVKCSELRRGSETRFASLSTFWVPQGWLGVRIQLVKIFICNPKLKCFDFGKQTHVHISICTHKHKPPKLLTSCNFELPFFVQLYLLGWIACQDY